MSRVMKLNKNRMKTYAFWIFLSEAVGVISALLTRGNMALYTEGIIQPTLSPPAVLFPIVWTVLYALMGIGSARVDLVDPSEEQKKALRLFLVQLAVNFFWSILFFNFRAFGLAFLWLLLLWVLIILMIRAFGKVDKPAAIMQIPYLLWVTFAGYLNFMVWVLNGM